MRIARIICCCISVSASTLVYAQTTTPEKPADSVRQHQLRIGFDLAKVAINLAQQVNTSYEAEVDYALRRKDKELYGVLEAGWGSAKVNYADLKYNSSNPFVRIGVDKGLLPRLFPKDWDMAFIGLRYGFAPVRRGEATFATTASVWNTTAGTVPAESLSYHWAELTGGIRVELLPGFFTGWNVRAKFLMNGSEKNELRPSYVAGYGKGDNNTAFDFNVWALYAIRWNK